MSVSCQTFFTGYYNWNVFLSFFHAATVLIYPVTTQTVYVVADAQTSHSVKLLNSILPYIHLPPHILSTLFLSTVHLD